MARLLILLVALVLAGCAGNSLHGRYVAEVELSGREVSPQPGYGIEEMRAKFEREPEALELKPDGTFVKTRGNEVIWEGKWRAEGESMVLRTEKVKGVAIQEKLQADSVYHLGVGPTIVDLDTFKPYGIKIVYRRKS